MKLIKEKADKVIMNTYNSMPISLVSGDGCYIKDSEGKEYLDFFAGIAVNTLGYNHPGFNTAVHNQLNKIIHHSNLFLNEKQIELADILVSNSHFDKVFFCNSGTESVEAALKLAKKNGKFKKNGAFKIIAMKKSFHGRTRGALSLTEQIKYREPFLPLLPGVLFAEFNNYDDLKDKVDSETCAIIIEPIQGEGGIYPAEKEYLEKIRELCTKKKIILIFDEVQCGIGRTGFLFAHEYFNIYPDIICLAKGLGGGLPIGAMLSIKTFDQFEPGDHGATFGGNPLVCAGAIAVLTELLNNKLLERTQKAGIYLKTKLNKLKNKYRSITDVRGLGLMLGMELTMPVNEIISSCIDNGLLLSSAGTSVIRFIPPLILTDNDIDKAVDIIDFVINKQ